MEPLHVLRHVSRQARVPRAATRGSLEDLEAAARELDPQVEKVFVADGDALNLDLAHWEPSLKACTRLFPNLRRASCYAMAHNVLEKSDANAPLSQAPAQLVDSIRRTI